MLGPLIQQTTSGREAGPERRAAGPPLLSQLQRTQGELFFGDKASIDGRRDDVVQLTHGEIASSVDDGTEWRGDRNPSETSQIQGGQVRTSNESPAMSGGPAVARNDQLDSIGCRPQAVPVESARESDGSLRTGEEAGLLDAIVIGPCKAGRSVPTRRYSLDESAFEQHGDASSAEAVAIQVDGADEPASPPDRASECTESLIPANGR